MYLFLCFLICIFLFILIFLILIFDFMCVRKIRILNKGYNPMDTLSTKYIEVPCGKCWQCRIQRSNDFSFRVLHEIKYHNLIPFFVTLTYNDSYLPVLSYRDKQNVCHDISVWNRQHLQNFHKVLRRQLQYYYGIDSSAFKYLCCCERGDSHKYIDSYGRERTATSRPHYHCIYMLSNDSDIQPVRDLPVDFLSYCSAHSCPVNFVNFFRYLLHGRWFFGHVDDISFCRDVVAAVRYVCKYIMKDYGENLFKIEPSSCFGLRDKRFDDLQHDCIASGNYKAAPKPVKFSDLLPRCISSINLGFSFVENKSFDELLIYCSGRSKVALPSVRNCSLINLPSYYFKKLCYNRVTLHLNRYYSERIVTPSGVVFGSLYTSPRYSINWSWNNVFGFEPCCNPSPYIRTSLSQFGKFLRRFNFVQSFKKIRNYASFLSFDKSFCNNLVASFNGFSSKLRQYYTLPSESFLRSLESVSLSFRFVDFLYYRRGDCHPFFTNIFNLVNLCVFTESHLRHIAFESRFNKKLCSTAFNNPDLFINHYL